LHSLIHEVICLWCVSGRTHSHVLCTLRSSVHKIKDCLRFQKFIIDLNEDAVADTFLTNCDK